MSKSKMTRNQHYCVDRKLGRRIFGQFEDLWPHLNSRELVISAPNPRRTVLLIPELRKRRSERDSELLRKQQLEYRPC